MARFNCDPCKVNSKEVAAVQWCVECEEAFCTVCVDSHKSMKMSRNHQLLEADKTPQKFNIFSEPCSAHPNLIFEFFCIDHDVLCCKECLAQSHRVCKKVMSVDVASKNAKTSQSFVDINREMNNILEALNDIARNRKANIEDVELECTKIKKEIAKSKDKLIRHINSLEKSLIDELNQMKVETVSKLQQNVTDAQELITLAKDKKFVLDLVQDHGFDKQAFVLVQISKRDIDQLLAKVVKLTEGLQDFYLKLMEIQSTDLIPAIGRLELTETIHKATFVPRKHRQSQFPVEESRPISSFTFQCEVDLKQAQSYYITGMTVSNSNFLLLCDNWNSRLIVCEERNNYRCSITTRWKPWDVTVIQGTQSAVVSSWNSCFIQFIDINKMVVQSEKKVPERQDGGIGSTKENIFVGTKGKIQVLDLQGSLVRSIEVKKSDIGIIRYLSLFMNGDICLSTITLSTFSSVRDIYCINNSGDILFTYKSEDNDTRKVVTDVHGSVYIAVWSGNIHRLSRNGTLLDFVLTEKDGIIKPTTVCFSKYYTKLYVANRDGKAVSVFTVNR